MKDLVIEINKILSNYSKGNKNTAYQKLKKIAVKYRDNEKIYFNLAVMEQDQGLYNQAKINYKRLIDNYDNNNAKINLYLIHIKEKDYLNALKIIDMLDNYHSSNNKIILDRAYIYLKINELENLFEALASQKDHNSPR